MLCNPVSHIQFRVKKKLNANVVYVLEKPENHITRYFESGCYLGIMSSAGANLLQRHYRKAMPHHLLCVYTQGDLESSVRANKAGSGTKN